MSQIKVYGADWCEDTQQTRRRLEHLGVRYDYLNVDFDSHAREFVRMQNDGRQLTPTVVVAGDVLVEPSGEELDGLLRAKRLLPGQVQGGQAWK